MASLDAFLTWPHWATVGSIATLFLLTGTLGVNVWLAMSNHTLAQINRRQAEEARPRLRIGKMAREANTLYVTIHNIGGRDGAVRSTYATLAGDNSGKHYPVVLTDPRIEGGQHTTGTWDRATNYTIRSGDGRTFILLAKDFIDNYMGGPGAILNRLPDWHVWRQDQTPLVLHVAPIFGEGDSRAWPPDFEDMRPGP